MAERTDLNKHKEDNMDIQTLLGEAYVEGMTIDEINTALADRELVDPTTLPKSVAKETFDKTASELAKLKKDYNLIKNSTLTNEELTKKALEDAEQAKIQFSKKLSELKAKEIFVGAGLSESDYTPLLSAVVNDDEEVTKTLATNLVNLINSQKEATKKSVETELLKKTPVPPAGDGKSETEITQEQFDKMGYTSRLELKTKNKDLYDKLTKI